MDARLMVLDLFSGIGGFSLGLEWTGGFRTVGFCEVCPKARKVLGLGWPDVPVFEDIRSLTGEAVRDRCGQVDVVCGGFPCQDISLAGKGEGLQGARSGLWFEMHRVISEPRPRWVIAENVSALRSRGLDRVLGSLAAIGYDAEWHCVPASAIGAPHRRDRVWIIAFPDADSRRQQERGEPHGYPSRCKLQASQRNDACRLRSPVADSEGDAGRSGLRQAEPIIDRDLARDGGADVPDSHGDRPSERRERQAPASEGDGRRTDRAGGRADAREERVGSTRQGSGDVPDADRPGRIEQRRPEPVLSQLASVECRGWWSVEPDVGRVAHGVPGRVDRLKQLGNAVVPHVPMLIGNAVLACIARRTS